MSGIIPLVETAVAVKVVEDVMDGGKKKQKKKVNRPRRPAGRRKTSSKKTIKKKQVKKRKGRKTNVIGTKSKNLGEELFGSGKLI